MGQGEGGEGVDRVLREDPPRSEVPLVEEDVRGAEEALLLAVEALGVQRARDLDPEEVGLAKRGLVAQLAQEGAGAAADIDDSTRAHMIADEIELAPRAVVERAHVGVVVACRRQVAVVGEERRTVELEDLLVESVLAIEPAARARHLADELEVGPPVDAAQTVVDQLVEHPPRWIGAKGDLPAILKLDRKDAVAKPLVLGDHLGSGRRDERVPRVRRKAPEAVDGDLL